ncbi:hypothetical protein ACFL6R_05175 [Gemmatimonadota bacterium]
MVTEIHLQDQPAAVKIFRWFFSISSLQVLLYYLVPALLFPSHLVLQIEVISALTLGNVVMVFYLLVNTWGVIIDRERRPLYTGLLVFLCLWFVLVVITWGKLERWEFLLR